MLFTYSITAWTSLIAAALISGGLMLKVKRIRLPRLTIFVTIIFLVLVALIIISKRRTPFTAYSLTSRIMFIKSALLMIKEKPFLGYGFGTFGAVNPNYIPAPEGFSRYAHNSYLQIWAETGIAGFLLFFAVIGLILKKAFEGLRNLRNKEEQLILIGLFCGILAFLLDNINSFTMLIANVSLFWWVVIAIMFAWVRKIF
jgi:O-antigen ligase